jgi:hypothetical protein
MGMKSWYKSALIDREAAQRYNWWLKDYTQNQNRVGLPPDDVWQMLTSKYPFEGGTLYRGINIQSQKQWETLQKGLDDGTVDFSQHVSSWFKGNSNAMGGAEVFALTRPTYEPNPMTFISYFGSRDKKEMLEGYRGLVIKTTVGAMGIDVDQSKYAKEAGEVILPPDSYQVEVVKVYKPYAEMIEDGEVDVNQAMSEATEEEINKANVNSHSWESGLLDHIISKQLDKLDPEISRKLFDAFSYEPPYWEWSVQESSLNSNVGESLIHEKHMMPYTSGKFFELGMNGGFDHNDDTKSAYESVIRTACDEWIQASRSNMNNFVDRGHFVRQWAEQYGFSDIISDMESIVAEKRDILEKVYRENPIVVEFKEVNEWYDKYYKNNPDKTPELEQQMKEKNARHRTIFQDNSNIKWKYERDLKDLETLLGKS